jgi:hypothetical protein
MIHCDSNGGRQFLWDPSSLQKSNDLRENVSKTCNRSQESKIWTDSYSSSLWFKERQKHGARSCRASNYLQKPLDSNPGQGLHQPSIATEVTTKNKTLQSLCQRENKTLSSSRVKPRPARILELYFNVCECTTGRNGPAVGRGKTATAFFWRTANSTTRDQKGISWGRMPICVVILHQPSPNAAGLQVNLGKL